MPTRNKTLTSRLTARTAALCAMACGAANPLVAAAGTLDDPMARIIGMDTRQVACINETSGQVVEGELPDLALDESFQCSELGFIVADQDEITLQAIGKNFAGSALNGEVMGFTPTIAICTNRRTDQRVVAGVAEDGTFDCEAAGLELMPEDSAFVQISGTIGEPPAASPGLIQQGMEARTALCENSTDPQELTIALPDLQLRDDIDCVANGLTVTVGDSARIQVRGPSPGDIRVTVLGLDGAVIGRCLNGATGQDVTFFVAEDVEGVREFSCVDEGLEIVPPQLVIVTVRGDVAPSE